MGWSTNPPSFNTKSRKVSGYTHRSAHRHLSPCPEDNLF